MRGFHSISSGLARTLRSTQPWRAFSQHRGKEMDAVLPDMLDDYMSFRPKIGKFSTALLKGMASATAEEVGAGVRAIRLGNGVKFLGDEKPAGDTIYERGFYPRLVSAIRGLDLRVILISNPGTGKSVFQYYLLARYANPSLFKDNDVPPPETIEFGPRKGGDAPKVVIRHVPKECMEVWFLEEQVVHVIEPDKISMTVLQCFDPETAVYFFEPGKTTNIEPFGNENTLRISTLETVSPDTSRYKEFRKVATKAYMPVYTKDELLAIGRDMRSRPDFPEMELDELYADQGISDRFDVFNGIIRHVLPMSQIGLRDSFKEREGAIDAVDALSFLNGDIEDGKVSHYLAVYDVDKDENGEYDFTSHTLKSAASDVKTTLEEKLKQISLVEKISVMRRFVANGTNKFDSVASVYEGLIADHLASDDGVEWEQRSVSTADPSVKANKVTQSAPTASRPATVKLNVKLAKSENAVPVFAEMKPNVLYRSLNKSFPFCDMLYLEDAGSGATTTMMKKKLVCVQVSIEGKGKRKVDLGVFSKFCERLGWGPTPTPEQLDLIEYVYCPLPSLADKAAVTFDEGVGISEYSVWHVAPNFTSKISSNGK